jgi:hypothetical protein
MTMASWNYTIEVGHVFRDEGLTFEQCRDKTAQIIRISLWANQGPHGGPVGRLAEQLAATKTIRGFNDVWDEVRNLAAADRCQINA